MAVVFSGDLSFNKMLSGEFFKTRFTHKFVIYSMSTMSTLKQYTSLLPAETEFLVLGCLASLVLEVKPSKVENRDVSISKKLVDFRK